MDSKKLLVLSDTHGDLPALTSVLKWAKNKLPPNDTICAAAFLGDGLVDIQRAADASGFYSEWKFVCGNNDYTSSIPESVIFDFAGHKFFLCHGHRHNLYSGVYSLVNAGRSNEANFVLFGHTHVPFNKTINEITLINPGSIGRPRTKKGASFAVIECFAEKTPPNVQFWSIGARGKILDVPLII